MMFKKLFRRYNEHMAFDLEKNKDKILTEVISRLDKAGIKDKEGFQILEGFVAPVIQKEISNNMQVAGKAFSQIAVIGKSTGLVYYFSLSKLFPEENYD